MLLVGLDQLDRARLDRPLAVEARDRGAEAGEVHPVGTRVGTGLAGDPQRRTGHRLDDLVRDLRDRDVVAFGADVERAVVHGLPRRHQRRRERTGDVGGVHQRSPRCAVGQHQHLAGQERVPDQVVQHDVGTQTRRVAERGGVAQVHRREVVVGQLVQVVLHPHLRLRVRGHRAQRRVLADQAVAAGGAVHRARRRVQEPADTRVTGQAREPGRGAVVDVVGEVRGERAERVVRQCGQVDDRVETLHVGQVHVTQVHRVAGRVERRRAEQARREQAGVQPHHLVARGRQHRRHDRAEVALVSGEQHSHG